MTTPNFQCASCSRFHAENRDSETCDAFPDGIPEDIIYNEFIHDKPFPGQKNDLVFKEG